MELLLNSMKRSRRFDYLFFPFVCLSCYGIIAGELGLLSDDLAFVSIMLGKKPGGLDIDGCQSKCRGQNVVY